MSRKFRNHFPDWEVMMLFAESLLRSDLSFMEFDLENPNPEAEILYPDYSLYVVKDVPQDGEILLDMDASEEEFQKQLDILQRKIRALEEETL